MNSSPDTNIIKVPNTAITGKIGQLLATDALEITDLQERLNVIKARGWKKFKEANRGIQGGSYGYETHKLKFSTKPNLPSWLSIDQSTGALAGRPPPNAQKLFKFKFECYAVSYIDNTEEKLGDSADVTITIARDPPDASSFAPTGGDLFEIKHLLNSGKVETAGSHSSVSVNGATTRLTVAALNTAVNTTAANLSATFYATTASAQVIGGSLSYSSVGRTRAHHHLEVSDESTRTYGTNAITFAKTYGPFLGITAAYATHDKATSVGDVAVDKGKTIVKGAPVHWVKLPLCEEKVRESLTGIVKFAETAREVLFMKGWVAAANQQMPGLDSVRFAPLQKGIIEYLSEPIAWADAGKPDTLVPLALSVKSPGAQQIDFLGNGLRKFTIGSATYLYFGGVISNIYATGTTLAAETMHTTIQSEFIQYFKCKPPLRTISGSTSLSLEVLKTKLSDEKPIPAGIEKFSDGPCNYERQFNALESEPEREDDARWANAIIKDDAQILAKLNSAKSHLPEVRELVGPDKLCDPIVVKNLVEGTYGIASVTESAGALNEKTFQWKNTGNHDENEVSARGLSNNSPHQLFELFNAAERDEKFLAKENWDAKSVTVNGKPSPRTRTRLVSPNMYFVGMVNEGGAKKFFEWNAGVNAKEIGAVDYLTTSPSAPTKADLEAISPPVDFAISGQASGLAFFGRRDLRLLSGSKLHLLGGQDVTLTSLTSVNVTGGGANLVLDSNGFTAKGASFTINGHDFVVRGIAAQPTKEMLSDQKAMFDMLAKKKEIDDDILEQKRRRTAIQNGEQSTSEKSKGSTASVIKIEVKKIDSDPSNFGRLVS